jgi:hypothetical protein
MQLHSHTTAQWRDKVDLRPSLFWDITQRRLVVSYRSFSTFRSHLQGSSSPRILPFLVLYAPLALPASITFSETHTIPYTPAHQTLPVLGLLRNKTEERRCHAAAETWNHAKCSSYWLTYQNVFWKWNCWPCPLCSVSYILSSWVRHTVHYFTNRPAISSNNALRIRGLPHMNCCRMSLW